MERDLVVRAQHGDVDAFSALTAGRTGRLYAAARLVLRDEDLAADAVQDALFLAWRDLRALRDPDRFDGWLHRLLVHAATDPRSGTGRGSSPRFVSDARPRRRRIASAPSPNGISSSAASVS